MPTSTQALVDPLSVLGFPLGHDAQRGIVEVGTPALVQGVIQSERVLRRVLAAVLYVIGQSFRLAGVKSA
jgi:hypothetical protein